MGTGPITDYSRENDGTGGGLHRSSLEMVVARLRMAYSPGDLRTSTQLIFFIFYFSRGAWSAVSVK